MGIANHPSSIIHNFGVGYLDESLILSYASTTETPLAESMRPNPSPRSLIHPPSSGRPLIYRAGQASRESKHLPPVLASYFLFNGAGSLWALYDTTGTRFACGMAPSLEVVPDGLEVSVVCCSFPPAGPFYPPTAV